MSRRAFTALGLCTVALAGVVALEIAQFEDSQPIGVVAPRAEPPAVSAAPSPPPLDRSGAWAATALARPLFAADRRPVAEPQAAPAAAARQELPRLAGVLVGPAGRAAIFAGAAEDAKPVVVREGDSLGGFEVKAIRAGQVTLLGPEGERVLHPSFDPRGGGATPSSPGTPTASRQPLPPGFPGEARSR